MVAAGNDGHWAFRPPATARLPAVAHGSWPRNAVDRFVLARLEALDRNPSPQAKRYALIRRLSLDLTGLPPTPDQVDTFVIDVRPDAYERLVDRLSASPHYGEHKALGWLDAVRFADTNGYETDRPRSIWPYRDWVINAFNSDMPYDQFAIEQIAGDLLPEATIAQRVATGFHRNTWVNEEGGHDWDQFRFESIVDRVDTTVTVFMGLTFACAQCHDHKYDPIRQEEYWRFFALLNNVDEPFLDVPVPGVIEKRERILAEVARLEALREENFLIGDAEQTTDGAEGSATPAERRRLIVDRRFAAWHRQEAAKSRLWTTLRPVRYISKKNATISPLEDGSLLVTGDRPEKDEYRVAYRTDVPRITGFLLEALPHPALPKHGPGRGCYAEDGSFALSEFVVRFRRADSDDAAYTIRLKDPAATHHFEHRTVDKAIDGNRLTNWHTQGRVGRAVWAVFATSEPITLEGETELDVTCLMNFLQQQTLGRFRLSITGDERPVHLPDHPRESEDLLARPAEQWSPAERNALRRYYLSVAPELGAFNKRIDELRSTVPPLPTTMVVQERKDPRPTYFHNRGEYLQREHEVTPGVPDSLHSLPDDARPNRLALARWIASPRNPLTGRVVMNQIWQEHFGQGLVTTTEDFGTQGEPPSHPRLLDWLATELVRSEWRIKAMHRLIVTSSVYRQSSEFRIADFDSRKSYSNPQSWEPGNKWLSRGPRYRVHAETIRDITLVASGLLTRTLGGPSAYPPRPDLGSGFAFEGMRWRLSEGADRYRRGLYTHRKRATPHPALAVFDAPARLTCKVKRRRSNTPLQALTLLNDECIVEAAQALARRVVLEAPSDDLSRARYAFRLCLTRPPDEIEVDAICVYYREQLRRLETGELNAARIAGTEQAPQGQRLEELAAWTTTPKALLNLDETITRQ